MLNSELKEDMWVVCLPGYNTDGNWRSEQSGGGGWQEDKIVLIGNVENSSEEGRAIAWPQDGSSGIFVQALRPATKWEIKHKQVKKEMNYEIY